MKSSEFFPSRRTALRAGLAGLLLPIAGLAKDLSPTPRQPRGPFYPERIPLDDDADLTWFDDRKQRAQGQITDLSGRLLDTNGKPLQNTRVEIWQCDAQGYYRHSRDRGGKQVDPNFQGHGHALSDAQGHYRFRTIRPVAYPGRTPHIHMAVFPSGDRPFVTQLYVAGEARNQEDFLYRSVPVEQRQLVQSVFRPSQRAGVAFTVEFDLILRA